MIDDRRELRMGNDKLQKDGLFHKISLLFV